MAKKKGKRSSRSLKQDRARRSKQDWERGKGARKKGNPRYQKVKVRARSGKLVTRYKVRKRK